MARKPARELIGHVAELIDLDVADNELDAIAERLGVLLDGSDQIAHLIDDTAELDVRFSASWEAYPV